MQSSIRIIPHAKGEPRVETGAVQFGEHDWPGLFIRGDNAGSLSLHLEFAIEALKKDDDNLTTVWELEGLLRLIRSGVIVK